MVGDRATGAVITHGPGLWLDGRACLLLWQQLCGRDRVPESAAEIKDQLRLAASEWLAARQAASVGGPDQRTFPDLATCSNRDDQGPRTASQVAAQLRVTPRHVRRLATVHHINPVQSQPYRWDDAAMEIFASVIRAA